MGYRKLVVCCSHVLLLQPYPIISELPAAMDGKELDPAHLLSAALLDLAAAGATALLLQTPCTQTVSCPVCFTALHHYSTHI